MPRCDSWKRVIKTTTLSRGPSPSACWDFSQHIREPTSWRAGYAAVRYGAYSAASVGRIHQPENRPNGLLGLLAHSRRGMPTTRAGTTRPAIRRSTLEYQPLSTEESAELRRPKSNPTTANPPPTSPSKETLPPKSVVLEDSREQILADFRDPQSPAGGGRRSTPPGGGVGREGASHLIFLHHNLIAEQASQRRERSTLPTA